MKRLLPLFIFLFLALPAVAVDLITATVIITNAPTTNGMSFVVNGSTRIWTNTPANSSTWIATNAAIASVKTNLFNNIALNPFSQVSITDLGSTNFSLRGGSGVAMAVSGIGDYYSVSYSTQVVTSMVGVRVPISGEPTEAVRTNNASLVAKGINDLSVYSFSETVTAFANLVGRGNAQSVTGAKTFTGANTYQNTGQIFNGGLITNVAKLTAAVVRLTNGTYISPALLNPTLTNGVNYGSPFSSPGVGEFSEVFGFDSGAAGGYGLAVGNGALANGQYAVAVGQGATVASGTTNGIALGLTAVVNANDSIAIGNGATINTDITNSVALGTAVAPQVANQIRLGKSQHVLVGSFLLVGGGLHVTNAMTNATFSGSANFGAHADVAFTRYAIATLANGNNSAIPVGTNLFVEVSGPSATFTNCGFANGRDGKLLVVVNQTGQDMYFGHQNGNEATAANRIITMTGADRGTTGNGAATLIYSGAASRWLLISLDP